MYAISWFVFDVVTSVFAVITVLKGVKKVKFLQKQYSI
jgi:hypothetical protein